LAVWLNSTVNFVQLFIERVPTGWFKVRGYTFADLKILSPKKLSDKEKKMMESTFNEISKQEFPCIWKQIAMNCKPGLFSPEWIRRLAEVFNEFDEWLGKNFEPRRKIDETILTILGYNTDRIKKIQEWLYPTLLKEIYILKKLNRVDMGS